MKIYSKKSSHGPRTTDHDPRTTIHEPRTTDHGHHGFILLGLLFMLVLMSVAAVAINRRSAIQNRMAGNQAKIAQTSLGQVAATDHILWQLTNDPFWRTGASVYSFNNVDYESKVQSASLTGCTDAVTISLKPSGAASGVTTAVRYYLTDLFMLTKPNHICRDAFNNIYSSDRDFHSVWKINTVTGIITRVAGNGTSGFSGDGGKATAAQLRGPRGVAVDAYGVIYIADTENHRIRKVDLAGNISTIAGTGTAGWSGDGGAAISARLRNPRGIFIDSQRNIFVADSDNHVIRKIDPSGIISTIAGKHEDDGFSGDGGLATSAKMDTPVGVFVDASGGIYVADTYNHRIRKFTEGGNITTIAGCGGYSWPSCLPASGRPATSTQLDTPCSVYVNSTTGDIYVADTYGDRIRRFLQGGNMTTVAGTGSAGYSGDGGPATSAQLDSPYSSCLKTTGDLVISDWMNSCLREVNISNVISTVTGTGTPSFNLPHHIAMDTGENVYIADRDNNRIRKLDPSGGVTTVAGTGSAGFSGDTGQAVSAQLNKPEGVAADGGGDIYIADSVNNRIRKVYMSGINKGKIYTIAGGGPNDPGDGGLATQAILNKPRGIHISSISGTTTVYIADTDNCAVRKFTEGGNIYRVAGKYNDCGYDADSKPATSAKLNYPEGVLSLSSGEFYIADTKNARIRKVNLSGTITTVVGTGVTGYTGDGGLATSAKIDEPRDVFLGAGGNMYVTDTNNHVIRVVDHFTNKIYTLVGTGVSGYNGDNIPAITSKLQFPAGVVMSTVRGGRKIYISDEGNSRVRILGLKMEKTLY